MALPTQLSRLIEQKRSAATDGVSLAFNHATQRVFEQEAMSGVRSSHGQARAVLACLKEAEGRLVVFTAAVKRILLAGRYWPTEADQTALLGLFCETMDWLFGEVHRRAETAAGQSTFDANAVGRALLATGEVRTRLRHEFEVMLVECAHVDQGPGPAISIVYNLVGDNPRVSNGGIDVSTNMVTVSAMELFVEIRKAITTHVIEPAMQRQLLETLSKLERQTASADRTKAYCDFVQVATPQLAVLTPFLPALAKWVQ